MTESLLISTFQKEFAEEQRDAARRDAYFIRKVLKVYKTSVEQNTPRTPLLKFLLSSHEKQLLKLETEKRRIALLWSLPDEATVDTRDAALMLGMRKRALEDWRSKRKGPNYVSGRPVMYRLVDLKRYQDGCIVNTTAS